MLKMGLISLFWTFSQSVMVIITYQFYFRYALTYGGVGGTMISNIHPFVWTIIILEYVISIGLIYTGMKKKS